MTGRIHDTGEEYIMKNGGDGDTFTFGLFSSEDKLKDSSDITDITTEPNSSGYSRVTGTLTSIKHQGEKVDAWGLNNPNSITIPVGDATDTIDSYFIAKEFKSTDKGDNSPQLHLISTGLLHINPVNLDDGFENIINITLPAGLIGTRLGYDVLGDKLYFVNQVNKLVEQTFSTQFDGLSISNTTRYDITGDIPSGEDAYGVEFDSTGRKLLVARSDGKVNEYILDNAYDAGSRELNATVTLNGSNKVYTALWNNDGTMLYETTGGNEIYQHTVNFAFEITSITNTTLITSTSDKPKAACWNDDGTKYYYITYGPTPFNAYSDERNDILYTNELNTPWDLTTISNTSSINCGKNYFYSSRYTNGKDVITDTFTGMCFSVYGDKLYLIDIRFDQDPPEFGQVELGTPFVPSSVSGDVPPTITGNLDGGTQSAPEVTVRTLATGVDRIGLKDIQITLNTVPKYLPAGQQ